LQLRHHKITAQKNPGHKKTGPLKNRAIKKPEGEKQKTPSGSRDPSSDNAG
jgi:hypothetical protein